MDKTKAEKEQKEIPCALLGSKVCPNPQECDGIHRLCTRWINHSGR